MTEPSITPRLSKRKQAIYALMPLLLLLLCLGVINFAPVGTGEGAMGGATAVSPGIVSQQQGGSLLATTTPLPPTATATPSPTPTPTPTPLPTLPPEAQISLPGPPDGSILPATAAISLFGTWPLGLREGEYLVAYLLMGEEERPLSPLGEPNMGSGYHWQLQPADLTGLGDEFRWQVRLESEMADGPLRLSETRVIRLLRN